MGACWSMPKVHDGPRMGSSRKNRRGRRILSRRVSSRKIDVVRSFAQKKLSHTNSALQSSNPNSDVSWFDSTSALDSDDEFYSVHDDGLSLNGAEIASGPSDSSPKIVDFTDQQQKLRVLPHSHNYSRSNSLLKIAPSKSEGHQAEVTSVLAGELPTSKVVDHCGLFPNTCLPCLSSNALQEKRRPSSPDTASSRRKSLSKLSFKFRERYADMSLFSPKVLKQKPLAGSMVPFCAVEKQMPGSWSPIEPSSFKVRGKNYFRDKKKDSAPSCAAFHPFGVDIFLSQRKINHIARFVQLPAMHVAGDVPTILIINLQIPLYPTAIFQGENDGEGINVVLYFKVSETYAKDLPHYFRENIRKFLNDEVERVKGFPLDTFAPFRERLKILGRVANVENLSLSATEKKLMNAYNERAVLSRPQHEFFLGENYLEIDLDVPDLATLLEKDLKASLKE